MKSGPMNYQLQMLLAELSTKARESRLWKRVIKDLMKPSRQRRVVNVYKIEKNAKDGETILVPGKVLSLGTISRKIDVAALTFSEEAERKIKA